MHILIVSAILLVSSLTPGSETATTSLSVDDRLRALEDENARLRDDLADLEARVDETETGIFDLKKLEARLTGWVDVGFFHVNGDGTGLKIDVGNKYFPEYQDVVDGGWVFMGDPLSTAINARGDPADTGDSRAVTFNAVDSNGAATFLVNSLGVALFAGIDGQIGVHGAVDFVPRGRRVSNDKGLFLGDYIVVRRAYAEWFLAFESVELSLQAGKFDPILGIEYRSQDAPDRMTVTPSLICRYTCGEPIGLKARAKLFQDAFVVNLALVNGSQIGEHFGFYDEVDSNDLKTATSRLSYTLDVGAGIELGISGAIGPQDGQPDDGRIAWHAGGDLKVDVADVVFMAEYAHGKAPGKDREGDPDRALCGDVPCIGYQGAYGLLAYRLFNWLTPYVRVDWRDALHQNGTSFIYVSQLMRVTPGLHFEFGTNIVVKAEYTVNRELGNAPQFSNDVLTTSLVAKY